MDTVDDTYLSIGEVLTLLKEEFPDVTISKIRFLESQGLIEPERTPSGYRRFHDPDIDRLRWVLRQQRDHFLPLKVIKAKIDEGTTSGMEQPPLWTSIDANGSMHSDSGGSLGDGSGGPAGEPAATRESPARVAERAPAPAPAPATADDAAAGRRDPGAWLAELQEGPPGLPAARSTQRAAPGPSRPTTDIGAPAERISFDELVDRSGAPPEHVESLVEYGLLHPSRVGTEALFDEDAIDVVVISLKFLEHGIEVRHLRSYRLAVDREAAVIEQLLLPLLKQRNPEARSKAIGTYEEFTDMGERLRRVLLHQALAPHLR